VVVHYPFHPRSGDTITVIGLQTYRGEGVLIIKQDDDTLTYLPPWMVEEASASMSVVEQPVLPFLILGDLARSVANALLSLELPLTQERSDGETEGSTAEPVRRSGASHAASAGNTYGARDAIGFDDACVNRWIDEGGAR
jgi:hypothetical protein